MSAVNAPDPPPRLTRAEAQARTRAALIEAAAASFASRGFHGTTVEDVVSRAGYTRGAFYSNFSDKDDLFLAVLDALADAEVAELVPLITATPSLEAVIARLRDQPLDDERARQWTLLLAEMRLHALRHPEVRPRLAAWEAAQRDGYRAAIEHLFARSGLPLPGDVDLMALVVQALSDGIAYHRAVEGDALGSDTPFLDALDLLLRAGAALSREQRG